MNSSLLHLFSGLPGENLIVDGLRDFHAGQHTVSSCLVRIARPRLSRAGAMDPAPPADDGAELDLYHLLSSSEDPASFSQYNALLRQLTSFEHALDHRISSQQPATEKGSSRPKLDA